MPWKPRPGSGNIDATKAVLGEPAAAISFSICRRSHLQLAEKVDLFWTSLNYHDLHVPKYANVDIAAFNKLVFASLKRAASISSSIMRRPRHRCGTVSDAAPNREADRRE